MNPPTVTEDVDVTFNLSQDEWGKYFNAAAAKAIPPLAPVRQDQRKKCRSADPGGTAMILLELSGVPQTKTERPRKSPGGAFPQRRPVKSEVAGPEVRVACSLLRRTRR